MKSRIAVGLLVAAIIGLTALNIYEARIIAHQRELIYELWNFVQTFCK